jgi:hypothetical protein
VIANQGITLLESSERLRGAENAATGISRGEASVSKSPAKGASRHVPGVCRCPRCIGFQPGHHYGELGGRPIEHGALRREHKMATDPRTLELAAQIREVAPVYEPADEFAVMALSVLLVRVERAQRALEELDATLEAEGKGALAAYLEEGERYADLRKDLRSWLSVAERYLAALGMTPGSRARLGLDLARVRSLTVVDWHAQVALEEASE